MCRECGNEWKASVSNRVKGRGCPVCKKEHSSSFAENIIYEFVKILFPDAISGYSDEIIKPYRIDTYIPSLRLGIEYDGERWHKNVKNDLTKTIFLSQNNISLIRIREKECPTIHDNSFIIDTEKPDYDEYNYMRDVIKKISKILTKISGVYCSSDCDLEEIKSKIRKKHYRSRNEKSLAAISPNLATEWDYEKNGSLRPELVYPQSNQRANWVCIKCGYKWKAKICNRTNGSGCPFCKGKRLWKGHNDFESQCPELMREWNYEKNEELDPGNITIGNSKIIVWWRCLKCQNEWHTSVYNRVHNNTGCPRCAARKKAVSVGAKHSKAVVCITTGERFNSLVEAGKAYGTGSSEICKCCKGKLLTSGKLKDGTRLKWKYDIFE